MKEKLSNDLSKLDVTIEHNSQYPNYSAYTLKHGERIIGYGWKAENKKEEVGFMGWASPAMRGCIWKVSSLPKELDFEVTIDLFQFAISDDYFWYSVPANRIVMGFTSKALTDTSKFIQSVKKYIDSDYNPEVFMNYQPE